MNTKPLKAGSLGDTSPWSVGRGPGGGAIKAILLYPSIASQRSIIARPAVTQSGPSRS